MHLDPGLLQLGDQGFQVRGRAVGDAQLLAAQRSGDEECARLDTIGNNAMPHPVQLLDALDADPRRARALDLGAHGVEQIRQIQHLGLAGAVFQDGFALGQGGGHQDVFGAGDGDLLEDNLRAVQPVGSGFHVSVFLLDLGAERFQALEVEIDRTSPNGAAAGQRDPSASHARHQRAQNQRGGPHGFDQVVRSFRSDQFLTADGGAMLPASIAKAKFDLGAHGGQQLARGFNVPDLRDMFQNYRFFGEQRRRHAGQRGVLGAADVDGAAQPIAAADDQLIHVAKTFL